MTSRKNKPIIVQIDSDDETSESPPQRKNQEKNEQTGLAPSLPPNFKWIQNNLYLMRAPPQPKPADLYRCDCSDLEKCYPNTCINACMQQECHSSCCRFGAECQNQRLQRGAHASVELKQSGDKGWGIYAKHPIAAGSLVIEYVGEVIDKKEFARRHRLKAPEDHCYFLKIGTETIDATRKGNLGRFINHSCDPNCESQKWRVGSETRVGIFAIKRIKTGEEITFDYLMDNADGKTCLCGAANCRGTLETVAKKVKAKIEKLSQDKQELAKYSMKSKVQQNSTKDNRKDLGKTKHHDRETIKNITIDDSDEILVSDSESISSEDTSDSSSEDDSDSDSDVIIVKEMPKIKLSHKISKNKEAQVPSRWSRQLDPSGRRSRKLVNKVPGGAPLFRKSDAHRIRKLKSRKLRKRHQEID